MKSPSKRINSYQDSATSPYKSDSINALIYPNNTLKKAESQTYITMGLCWSENAQIYKKENFPYRKAALLSVQLWRKFTPTKVILQIIYSEPEISEELKAYKIEMESHNVLVYLLPTGKRNF